MPPRPYLCLPHTAAPTGTATSGAGPPRPQPPSPSGRCWPPNPRPGACSLLCRSVASIPSPADPSNTSSNFASGCPRNQGRIRQFQHLVWFASALVSPSQLNAHRPRRREHPTLPDALHTCWRETRQDLSGELQPRVTWHGVAPTFIAARAGPFDLVGRGSRHQTMRVPGSSPCSLG